jgi:hypothetical protein
MEDTMSDAPVFDNAQGPENSVLNFADAVQRKQIASAKGTGTGNVWADRKKEGYKPFKPLSDDGRLPRVDPTDDGGFTICRGETVHLRLAIIKRAKDILPKSGIFLRQSNLFSIESGESLDQIPPAMFAKLFRSMRVTVTETQEVNTGTKKKTITIQRPVEADLECFEAIVTNQDVTNVLVKNKILQELVYENEIGQVPDVVRAGYHTPEVGVEGLSPESEAKTQATRDFNAWATWMGTHKPRQLSFFAMMLKEFLHGRALGDKHQRRLNIGIGPNGSGKGSMVRMLEIIPNLAPVGTFDLADALCEYRSGNIFSAEAAPLMVCHEWKLDIKTPPQIQAAFKAALRGEAVNARSVGSATTRVKARSGYVLFCNTDRDKEENALEECFDYFGAWHATDRFNVAWIDWFRAYPDAHTLRARYLSAEAAPDLQAAFGLAVYAFGKSLLDMPIAVHEIPRDAVEARSRAARPALEKKIDALLFAWGRIMAVVESTFDEESGQPIPVKKQQEIARNLLRPVVGKNLEGFLTAEDFFPAEGFIRPSMSSALAARLLSPTGSQKWKIPECYAENVLKNAVRNHTSHVRGILFRVPDPEPDGLESDGNG